MGFLADIARLLGAVEVCAAIYWGIKRLPDYIGGYASKAFIIVAATGALGLFCPTHGVLSIVGIACEIGTLICGAIAARENRITLATMIHKAECEQLKREMTWKHY